MNVSSRQLKAFVLAARHQSFSRAAEQLFITQPGMSMLLRELEGQLGFRLFDRTTRKVALTELGSKLLPVAERSLLEFEAAALSIGRSATANRRLAIGATPLIASRLLPSAISGYVGRSPGLKIVLRDGELSGVVAMTLSGQADIGLGCFIAPVSGVRRVALYRFSLMLIEPAAGPQPRSPRWTPWQEMKDRYLIGLPPDNPIQQLIDRTLQRVGRRAPPDSVLSYLETQIAMVAAGAGSAVVPTFTIPACRAFGVAMHPLTDPCVPLDLCRIAHRGRKLPPEADEFTEFFKTYVAQWAQPWSQD
ncbi:MAG TPA: LysR family transcriptional regulator [Burkholderiales bacterium]|nr:LysR family transcriptional regulator [Burkholderiales bacterium]